MKKLAQRLVALAFVVAVGAVMVSASNSSAAGGGGTGCGPRNCLDVWNPVICSNGVVYSNSCYAARACATGCVPFNPNI
ncbi:MAG: hypothetical protein JSR77_14650 [Planctomycetes bacterium]|nr:hypothetical protein [Planctomycetota bacterium]